MELADNLAACAKILNRELKQCLQNAWLPRRSPRQLHYPGCAHPNHQHSNADERGANGEPWISILHSDKDAQ